LDLIFNNIKYVETNNNPNAIGDNGKAYGVVQIHKICIKDVNKTYNTNFTHEDAFNEEISKEIFKLYIRKGIKIFYRKHGRNPNEEEVVRMWNGGIYKGYIYKSTKKYYQKYLIIKSR